MVQVINGNNDPILYMGDAKLLTEDDLRKSASRRRIEQPALTKLGNLKIATEGHSHTISSNTLMQRQKLNSHNDYAH